MRAKGLVPVGVACRGAGGCCWGRLWKGEFEPELYGDWLWGERAKGLVDWRFRGFAAGGDAVWGGEV